MTTEPIDPRALRWVEAGVSGLARSRDWDRVELVTIAELADEPLEEFQFGVLADGTVVGQGPPGVAAGILERLAACLSDALDGPYEAVAARRTRLEWSLAARALRIEELVLPPLAADEILVAVSPDGEPTVLVDGEEPDAPSNELDAATARLLALGRERFDSFVIRARRARNDRWAISVDPL